MVAKCVRIFFMIFLMDLHQMIYHFCKRCFRMRLVFRYVKVKVCLCMSLILLSIIWIIWYLCLNEIFLYWLFTYETFEVKRNLCITKGSYLSWLNKKLQISNKIKKPFALSIIIVFDVINLCKTRIISFASISTKCVENHCSAKTTIKLPCVNITFMTNCSRYCKRCFYNEWSKSCKVIFIHHSKWKKQKTY